MGIDKPTGHEEAPQPEEHLPTPNRNTYPIPQYEDNPIFDVSNGRSLSGGPHRFRTEDDARAYIKSLREENKNFGRIDLCSLERRGDGKDKVYRTLEVFEIRSK